MIGTIDSLKHKYIAERVITVMEEAMSHYTELGDAKEVIIALGRLRLLAEKCTEPYLIKFMEKGAEEEENFLLTKLKGLEK
jgi:hypothetical protein